MKRLLLSLLTLSFLAANLVGMEQLPLQENQQSAEFQEMPFANSDIVIDREPKAKTKKKILPTTKLGWLATAAGTYGVYFSSTYLHELGHWTANKLLIGAKNTSIYVDPIPFKGGRLGFEINPTDKYTTPNRLAMFYLAGPVAGIASCYGLLKGINIGYEYLNNGFQFKDAIKKGIKKPLINKDQSFFVQMAVAFILFNNFRNLIPSQNPILDGNRALMCLNIENPAVKYPVLNSLATGLTTWGLIPANLYILYTQIINK